MKRAFIGIGTVALCLAGALWWWVGRNAQSALPLIAPPSEDIGALVASGSSPFSLPPGFTASVFARDVPNVRVMRRDPRGTIVATLSKEGKVIALPDDTGDGIADRQVVVLSGLRQPHGILFYENSLYVAETYRVMRYSYDPLNYQARAGELVLSLPEDGYNQHWSRTLYRVSTPLGERLMVSIGSSCNVCDEAEPYRATIVSANFDGSDAYVFARGLRNSVFMATHPVTGALWATEMGRDFLGDDTPPDEVNIISEGGNYGWPTCYGKNIHDREFDTKTYIRAPCTEPYEIPSHIDIPAHSAPLGLAFVPEEGWPEAMWHDLLVAYHGSWNRSSPAGYKIVRMRLSETGAFEGEEDFMTGFIKNGDVLGRPVDILIEPGGVMFVSDDRAGVIYRITWNP